jgi:hypothetical protein
MALKRMETLSDPPVITDLIDSIAYVCGIIFGRNCIQFGNIVVGKYTPVTNPESVITAKPIGSIDPFAPFKKKTLADIKPILE